MKKHELRKLAKLSQTEKATIIVVPEKGNIIVVEDGCLRMHASLPQGEQWRAYMPFVNAMAKRAA